MSLLKSSAAGPDVYLDREGFCELVVRQNGHVEDAEESEISRFAGWKPGYQELSHINPILYQYIGKYKRHKLSSASYIGLIEAFRNSKIQLKK